jgi:hypothetical protein
VKRLIWLGFVVAIAACSGGSTGSQGTGTSGGKGTTGGGCATALCGGECCASGDSCIASACCPALLSCGSTCCPSGGACIKGACCPGSQACGTVCCPGMDADGGQAACVNNACCPIARACKDICCDADSECITDLSGNSTCNKLCQKSSDCSDGGTPCCQLVENGQGAFSGHGICNATPSPASAYACLCAATPECDIFGAGNYDCGPAVNTAGYISGPYICVQNDGATNQGCGGGVMCTGTDQFCATDALGNKFCSDACATGMDFQCGNAAVACCNNVCANTDGNGNMCCGLCPPSG